MRELTASEIQEVNGGDQIDNTFALVGAIGGLSAIFGLPAAAAFAGGVVFGGMLTRYAIEMY